MSRVFSLAVAVLALGASSASGSSAAAAAPPATPIAVALGLGHPLLQAGVVRGRDVILARGFEVELARVLARRLGTRVDRFAYVPSTRRLLASGTSSWQLAVAGIERASGTGARLSASYLTTDVAVVARRGWSDRGGSPIYVRTLAVPREEAPGRPFSPRCACEPRRSSSQATTDYETCCGQVRATWRSCRRSRSVASSLGTKRSSDRSWDGSGTATGWVCSCAPAQGRTSAR